jgi:hypothetical protein
MWHKARAQLCQGVVGRLHHLGRPAMCWPISKNCFVYVSSREGVEGIQCSKVVQGGNLAVRPSSMVDRCDKWASHTQSSARVLPYSSYKYHSAPLVESVKKVRFSPPLPSGFQIQSLYSRERGEVLRAGGLPGLSRASE